MSKTIPFDAVVVGESLGPVEWLVDRAAVDAYIGDWADPNPLFVDGAGSGPAIAPPGFHAGLTCFQLLRTKFDSSGTLDAKSEHENLGEIPIGSTLTTTGRFADKYVRRGLEYIVIESESRIDGGTLVRRSRDHIVLTIERQSASPEGT